MAIDTGDYSIDREISTAENFHSLLIVCEKKAFSTLLQRDTFLAVAILERVGDDGYVVIKNTVKKPIFREKLERHRTLAEATKVLATYVSHIAHFDGNRAVVTSAADLDMNQEDPITNWLHSIRGALLAKNTGII